MSESGIYLIVLVCALFILGVSSILIDLLLYKDTVTTNYKPDHKTLRQIYEVILEDD